jgi:hypothetical protein
VLILHSGQFPCHDETEVVSQETTGQASKPTIRTAGADLFRVKDGTQDAQYCLDQTLITSKEGLYFLRPRLFSISTLGTP